MSVFQGVDSHSEARVAAVLDEAGYAKPLG